MKYFVEGFLLQASLILALGAQNLFVLESGLKKRSHLLVAFLCSVCDAVLITIGVAGAASVFVRVPALKIGFGFLGVAFLVYYGLLKIRQSLQPEEISLSTASGEISARKIILMTLAFSLLNPHVYLDTVILIGGYSARYSELLPRIQFGIGAASFSVLWFYGLALFASALSHLLQRPKSRQTISLIAGIILLGLSLKLGNEVRLWVQALNLSE